MAENVIFTLVCSIVIQSVWASSYNLTDNCQYYNGSQKLICNGDKLSTFDFRFVKPREIYLKNIATASYYELNESMDSVTILHIEDCSFDVFETMTNYSLPELRTISFSNGLSRKVSCGGNFDHLLLLGRLNEKAPNLERIQLVNVGLCNRIDVTNYSRLASLDLSHNFLSSMPDFSAFTKSINVSNNVIAEFDNDSSIFNSSLNELNLGDNNLYYIPYRVTSVYPRLKILVLSGNPISNTKGPFARNEQLERLEMERTNLEVLDVSWFGRLINLKLLSVANSKSLRFIYGNLAQNLASATLDVQNSSVKSFSTESFAGLSATTKIDVSLNPWSCDCRLRALLSPQLLASLINLNNTFCFTSNGSQIYISEFLSNQSADNSDCQIGTAAKNGNVFRTIFGLDKVLDCEAYGQPTPDVVWYKYGNRQLNHINSTDFHRSFPSSKFLSYPDGTLKIKHTDADDVGIYLCRVSNIHGNLSVLQKFRFDYAGTWWMMKIYSIVCGILLAMAFFALNVISGAIRRLVAWRISKLERTGRVRLLLESIEKYRTRQVVNLHEMYASNVNQIRDNYHQQIEALRRSYSAQAERFRGYRATRMEHVTNHLDALRDNYNSQVHRIRDYGGKQMERVWDIYQRQLSGLRDYSLQHRLRLMRQYKLKQRYLNIILENLNLSGSGSTTACDRDPTSKNGNRQQPEFIEMRCISRAVDLPDPPTVIDFKDIDIDHDDRMSQASTDHPRDDADESGAPPKRCSSDSFLSRTTSKVENDVSKEKCRSQTQLNERATTSQQDGHRRDT